MSPENPSDTSNVSHMMSALFSEDCENCQPPRVGMVGATTCLAAVYTFITVVGLTANAAVLYMIASSRSSKGVTSIYIFNLALADMLYVIWLPAAVYQMFVGQWTLGHIMCKLYYTCDGVSKFASVMFLVVLSFDRYMAVCQPVASRAARTAKVAFAASGVSWILVILAMAPVFVYAMLVQVTVPDEASTLQCVIYWPPSVVGNYTESADHDDDSLELHQQHQQHHQHQQQQSHQQSQHASHQQHQQMMSDEQHLLGEAGMGGNETDDVYETDMGPDTHMEFSRRIFTLYLFTLSFFAPLLLVWIFYIMILQRLWQQKRAFVTAQTPGGKSTHSVLLVNRANQRRRRSTKRVTIMVLSIVVAYTVCWLPYWCVQLTIEFFRDVIVVIDFDIFTTVSYIAYGIQSSNSALNPFLYAFGTEAHRRRLLNWLRYAVAYRRCCPRGKSDARPTDVCRRARFSALDTTRQTRFNNSRTNQTSVNNKTFCVTKTKPDSTSLPIDPSDLLSMPNVSQPNGAVEPSVSTVQ